MCAQIDPAHRTAHATYSEYVRVPARNCFAMPEGLSFEQAAAIPMAYLTVWRMLMVNAALKPGERVLIVGAGGGIGSAALQVAARLGAHVIVTSRCDETLTKAKELGAAHGINGEDTDFAKETRRLTNKRGVDVVVDSVGAGSWSKSLEALAKGGRLVICGGAAGTKAHSDVRRVFWNHLQLFGSSLGSRDDFLQVLKFIRTTGTRPIIDRIFSLSDAAAAHNYFAENRRFGKIVLRMDN
jgi:NADPH2:quinone reductase